MTLPYEPSPTGTREQGVPCQACRRVRTFNPSAICTVCTGNRREDEHRRAEHHQESQRQT